MWETFTGNSRAAAPLGGPQSPGPGGVSGVGGWHPTILYLGALLIAEILIAGILSRTVLR